MFKLNMHPGKGPVVKYLPRSFFREVRMGTACSTYECVEKLIKVVFGDPEGKKPFRRPKHK
jgi:hypothetical protein